MFYKKWFQSLYFKILYLIQCVTSRFFVIFMKFTSSFWVKFVWVNPTLFLFSWFYKEHSVHLWLYVNSLWIVFLLPSIQIQIIIPHPVCNLNSSWIQIQGFLNDTPPCFVTILIVNYLKSSGWILWEDFVRNDCHFHLSWLCLFSWKLWFVLILTVPGSDQVLCDLEMLHCV